MTRRGEKTSDAYGRDHQTLRAWWAPIVATGDVECWRCHTKIRPDQPWDLGHNDDRTKIMGPEHRHAQPRVGCPGNRAKGWAKLRRPRPTTPPRYGGDDEWNDDR